MAEVNQQQVIEYIKGISVLELSQLVKALESELGVSAAAAMPMAMPNAVSTVRAARAPSDPTPTRTTSIGRSVPFASVAVTMRPPSTGPATPTSVDRRAPLRDAGIQLRPGGRG